MVIVSYFHLVPLLCWDALRSRINQVDREGGLALRQPWREGPTYLDDEAQDVDDVLQYSHTLYVPENLHGLAQ